MLVSESVGETFDVFCSVCGSLLPLLLCSSASSFSLSRTQMMVISFVINGVFSCKGNVIKL